MANEELVEMQNQSSETLEGVENTVIKYSGKEPEVIKDEIDQILEAIPDEKPAEEDFLVAFFERHKEQVMFGVRNVSLRGLRRVMVNVALGEFAPSGYDPKNDDERKLAFHFNECVTKRGVLRLNEEFKRVEAQMAKEQEDLKKIDQMTQEQLTPEAKQMLAEAGDKVEINE